MSKLQRYKAHTCTLQSRHPVLPKHANLGCFRGKEKKRGGGNPFSGNPDDSLAWSQQPQKRQSSRVQGPWRRGQKRCSSGDGQTQLVLGTPSPAGLETRASTALKSTDQVCGSRVGRGGRTLGGGDEGAASVGHGGLRARPALGCPPALRPTREPSPEPCGQPAAGNLRSPGRPASRGSRYPQPAAAPGRSPPLRPPTAPAPLLPDPKKVLGLPAPRGPASGSRGTHQSSSGTRRGLASRPRPPRPPGDRAPPAAAPPAPLLLAARVRASHLPSSL